MTTDDTAPGMGGEEPEFWFCLKHHTVEGRDGCRNSDRLGPYATQAEAASALEHVAERNEEWDREDAEDREDD